MTDRNNAEANAQTVKKTVEDQFSPVAANYATSTVHQHGAEFKTMLELADLTGDEFVLDAGCGAGHTALTFAPHVQQVTAVDLTEAMLEQGRQLANARGITNIQFEKGDVEQLPFEDNSFDVIVTRYSAHHWPSPHNALSEFRRTLRSNDEYRGRLLIADVVSFQDYASDTHLQTMEVLRDPSHVRDHTTHQWLTMLEAAGFEASVQLEWPLPLDFDAWVERMRTPEDTVTIIRRLLRNAPDVVQRDLRIEADCSFTFTSALFYAVPVA